LSARDVPGAGRAMMFPEWSAAIVAGVRVFLPDAKAVRKGARVVVIRHGEREARCSRTTAARFGSRFPPAR
jgi:hypothetical protein